MAKIKEGMTEQEVLAILGKPDDTRTEYDPGGMPRYHIKKICYYGTDGHLTFGTLGSIYIDDDGKVKYIFGGEGEPPPASLFSEAELRSLLRLIHKAPSYNDGLRYDPLVVIRIVNTLQPLGKERALAAIDEYLRVASDEFGSPGREGVFLVLRVLFDVPPDPGYMPMMFCGRPSPEGPHDSKQLPRFPILLIDDVPLLLVHGYSLGGSPEQPESHVEYFRKKGLIRSKPLVPPDSPLRLYDSCVKTAGWPKDTWANDRKLLVANQLLTLVDSVYRTTRSEDGYRFWAENDADDKWKVIAGKIAKLDIRWNAKKCCYTFKDGTCLPEPERTIYQRKIWRPKGMNGDAAIIFERTSKSRVSVGLTWMGDLTAKMPEYTLDVVQLRDKYKSHPLGKVERDTSVDRDSYNSFLSQWFEIDAAEGTEFQRLTIGKREQVSPVLKP